MYIYLNKVLYIKTSTNVTAAHQFNSIIYYHVIGISLGTTLKHK